MLAVLAPLVALAPILVALAAAVLDTCTAPRPDRPDTTPYPTPDTPLTSTDTIRTQEEKP
ncbi:hypothetical protein [Streptomyces sp. NRRL S-1896]|uniref:hypothetical protein n=1 Tax=Streptomyces sp. NRRL S-1896 TaxID=1463893 RepID=UPI0004C8FC2C|nr:hypothetical protein [Streptomyces sp. NRRL S-1896]